MQAFERVIDLELGVFVGMTLVIMGGGAILMGQALANTWRPARQVFFYAVPLAIATRFFSLALFYGDPFFHFGRWAYGSAVDFVCLAAYGLLAYRVTHVWRMAQQYPWLVRRTGIFTYRYLGNPVDDTSESVINRD
jgi:Domain of unknown function (DUF6867)